MPDSQPPERRPEEKATPSTPPPVPSPPVPSPPVPSPPVPSPPLPTGFKTPAPVPSPPLPSSAKPAAPAPAKPAAPKPIADPFDFKLTSDAEPTPTPAPQVPTQTSTKTPTQQPPIVDVNKLNPVAPATKPAAKAPQKNVAPAAKPPVEDASTPVAPRTPELPRTPSLPKTAATQNQNPAAPQAPSPRTPSLPVPSASHPIGSTPATAAPAPNAAAEPASEFHKLGIGGEIRLWLDKAEPVFSLIFRIALAAGVLSLAFILYNVFTSKLGTLAATAPQIKNLHLADSVLQVSIILMVICGILLALDVKALGIALVVGGLALHFGAPWALFAYVGKTKVILDLVNMLRVTGVWLVTLGVLRFAYDLMQWIVELPDRKKQRADVGVGRKAEAAQLRIAKSATMFSPCWKLPFCREAIRKQCPAFLAKKTCWKFKRGCYCDEEMISRIIKGESLEVIKAPTRMSKTGKPPCGRCHIYLEHQGYKYKILSPLAVPLTGLAMFFIWPFWTQAFMAFSTAKIWDSFSIDTKKITPGAMATDSKVSGGLPPEQVMHVASILFGVLLGFLVLTYICKFIEWFVYKAKL